LQDDAPQQPFFGLIVIGIGAVHGASIVGDYHIA
jgi:hypothetical protein